MKIKLDKLLKNKMVLYITFFLASSYYIWIFSKTKLSCYIIFYISNIFNKIVFHLI